MKFKALLNYVPTEGSRTNPIYCDYYYLLIKVGEISYVSGVILSQENKVINLGEQVHVEIYIHSDNLIGEVFKGQVLTFWEPPFKIGEITVTEINNEV